MKTGCTCHSFYICSALTIMMRAYQIVWIASAVLVGAFAGSPDPAAAQLSWDDEMRNAIYEVLEEHDASTGTWHLTVKNLETNELLVEQHSHRAAIPASVVKVLTSAAALELLGPDFQYETALTATAPRSGDTVPGDLILHGSGDPSLGSVASSEDVLANWANGLYHAGVRHVEGRVIGDDTRFDEPAMAPGWSWDDRSYAYAAQSSALSYRQNVVDVEVEAPSHLARPRVTWRPENTSYITVSSNLERVSAGHSIWRSFTRRPGQNVIEVRGRIPAGRSTEFSVTVDNPTLFTATLFDEALQRNGITTGDFPALMRDVPPPATQDTLTTVYSPPLYELVKTMNQDSNNLYAEQIMHTLGAYAHGDSLRAVSGTRARGIRLTEGVLQRAGVSPSNIRLVDGSGLSRYNLISTGAVVDLLVYMWNHPDPEVRQAFWASLPVGGQSGTLRNRFQRATVARGNVRAKTGTLSNTSALAGYVTSLDGTPLAFAIIINNHVGSTRPLRAAQDHIVNILAQYPR